MPENPPNWVEDIQLHIQKFNDLQFSGWKRIHPDTNHFLNAENQIQKILKAVREKLLILYNRSAIWLSVDFTSVTMGARKQCQVY